MNPSVYLALIRFGIYALVLATPFVVSAAAADNYRLPKEVFVQCVALVLISIYGLERFLAEEAPGSSGAAKPGRLFRSEMLLKRPLVAPLALIALLAILQLPWSENPPQGRRAIINLLLYTGLIILAMRAASSRFAERVIQLSLIAASASAALAIVQFYGYEPFAVQPLMSGASVASARMGNPNISGAYLALVAPAALSLLLLARRLEARLAIGLGLALTLAGTIYAGAFDDLSALAVGLALWMVAALIAAPKSRKMVAAGAALVVLAGGLGVASNDQLRARFKQRLELARAGNWDNLLSARYQVWLTAREMLRARPFLGHGLGSYGSLFHEFWPKARASAEIPLQYLGTSFAAQAHNEYLQLASELGLVGLALGLLAAAQLLWVCGRFLFKGGPAGAESAGKAVQPEEQERRRLLVVGLTASFIAFLVNALFNFALHTAVTASLVAIYAGLAAGLSALQPLGRAAQSPPHGKSDKENKKRRRAREEGHRRAASEPRKAEAWAALAAALLVAALGINYLIKPYRASLRLRLGQELFNRATGGEASHPVERARYLQIAERNLVEAARLDHSDARIHMLLGNIYVLRRDYARALESYKRAAEYLPSQIAYTNIGATYMELGQRDAARAAFEKALWIDPHYGRASNGLEQLKKPGN